MCMRACVQRRVNALGSSALHIACEHGRAELASLLWTIGHSDKAGGVPALPPGSAALPSPAERPASLWLLIDSDDDIVAPARVC